MRPAVDGGVALDARWSENWDRPPEQPFRTVVRLRGWEAHSVWGYDGTLDSFVAVLQPDSGGTVQSVGLIGPPLRWADCLAVEIMRSCGCDPLAAVRALGIARPHAELRPEPDLSRTLLEWRAALRPGPGSGYEQGRVAGLAWALGAAGNAPASGWPMAWDRPTPEQVDAECVLATARVYVGGPRPRDFYTGVEEALDHALEG